MLRDLFFIFGIVHEVCQFEHENSAYRHLDLVPGLVFGIHNRIQDLDNQ